MRTNFFRVIEDMKVVDEDQCIVIVNVKSIHRFL